MTKLTISVLALLALAACGDDESSLLTHPAGDVVQVSSSLGAPYGVAVSRTGVTYAALISTNTLVRGNLTSMAFPDTVIVGDTPPHVTFRADGEIAFSTLQTGMGVAVVNVATNTLITTIPLSSDGFNLIASANRVYATTAGGQLYVINASTPFGVITTLNVGAAANGLAFSPDGKTLYVSSRDAGTITAINTATNAITRTYPVGGMLQRLAVSPDGGTLFIASETAGLVSLNLASGTFTTLSFGTPAYGLGITPDGEQLYVLLPDLAEARVLNRATLAPLNTIFIGGRPRNVAFDSTGTTALIANELAVTFIE